MKFMHGKPLCGEGLTKKPTITRKSYGRFISFSEKSPELIRLLFLNELQGSRGTETMTLKAIWTKYSIR